MANKSKLQIASEALHCGGLVNVEPPLNNLKHRKLSIDEIKEFMMEEFGKAKKAEDVEFKEPDEGWADNELEKEIEWMKALKIKEVLGHNESGRLADPRFREEEEELARLKRANQGPGRGFEDEEDKERNLELGLSANRLGQ